MSGTIDIVRQALSDLEARERKLKPLVVELDHVHRAIRDVRALLLRLEGTHDGSKTGQRKREWNPSPESQSGRILHVLTEHPRGMHVKVIAEDTGVPRHNVDSLLPRLLRAGFVERPSEGFYKIVNVESTNGRVVEH